jgi:hypothetical protein
MIPQITTKPLINDISNSALQSLKDLITEHNLWESTKAYLNSPIFTGNPQAPTASVLDNTASIATTAHVKAVIAALVASSPLTLDTLNELAAALGNDPNFATTVMTLIGTKEPLITILSATKGGTGVNNGSNNLTVPNTGTAHLSYVRTCTSQSLAINTNRKPSLTRDVFVVVNFNLTGGNNQLAKANVLLDNNGGLVFQTIGETSSVSSALPILSITQQQSISFVCPMGSNYKWTNTGTSGGTPSITSIFELVL